MTAGVLRVNTGALASGGQGLLSAADGIPAAPTPVVVSGGDPLSAAVAAQLAKAVAPLAAARPAVKEDVMRYAHAVLKAGRTYQATDTRISDNIHRQMSGIPGPGAAAPAATGSAPLGVGGGGGVGGTSPVAGGAPAGIVTGVGGPSTAAGAQSAGLGQLMGMPLQMASQAGQVPTQMGGMLGAIPHGVTQGAQAAMGQMAQSSNKTAGGPDAGGEQVQQPSPAGGQPAESAGAGAAAGQPNTGRAPVGNPRVMLGPGRAR